MTRPPIARFALLVAFAVPAPAAANVNSYGGVQRSLEVARAYWQAEPPCPDGVAVTIGDAQHGYLADAAGWAGNCEIVIGHTWQGQAHDLARWCILLTHEWGHLLGYDHIDDRSNVMSPQLGLRSMPACLALRDRAWTLLDHADELRAFAHELSCRCTTRRIGVRLRTASLKARHTKRFGLPA